MDNYSAAGGGVSYVRVRVHAQEDHPRRPVRDLHHTNGLLTQQERRLLHPHDKVSYS
ncbi:hypothetical protein [Nocardiopsis nanhaiensis]